MSNTFDLSPYNLSRPEKIIWRFNLNKHDVLQSLPSKSLRSFLAQTEEILSDQQITYTYQSVTRDEFATWLDFYTAQMIAQDYDTLADLNWYDKRTELGRTIEGLFFHQAGKLIGSAIIVKDGQLKATLAFKASQRVDISNHKNASFGAIIDYVFLQQMVKQGIATISGGRSRNAFGVINKLGYIEYKMRLGYLPVFDPTAQQATTVPLNDDQWVMFFAPNEVGVMVGHVISPTNHPIITTINNLVKNLPIKCISTSTEK